MCGCTGKPNPASTPARSTSRANPAVANGEPRSLTNTNGDLELRLNSLVANAGHIWPIVASPAANRLIWPRYVPSAYGARFAYGHIVEQGRHMIVSGGLGVSSIPVRIGVPPEIVRVELG